MSSINFNASATVALDTLKGINKNMSQIQSQISTGKTVSSAKDNAAVWAISKVMESDVSGFSKISESLSIGGSTVAVARAATEEITDLLTEMKDLVVAGQEENQDRSKLQADVDRYNDQITSIIDAAQLNGVNLLSGSDDVSFLSSLDRSTSGVTSSEITVSRQDLKAEQSIDTTDGVYAAGTGANTVTVNDGSGETITVGTPTAGVAYSIGLTGATNDGSVDFTGYDAGGDAANSGDIAYVARDGDTAEDVAAGLAAAYAQFAADNSLDTEAFNITADGADLNFSSAGAGVADADDTVTVTLDTVTSDANVASGVLNDVADIDVTTDEGAAAALTTIETAIQGAVDAAASFGSAEKRIENQQDFVGKLMDSMKAGISALTDTNMEEASARLQSLQVQQQLGVQALSIANGSSQSILSLFRG